MRERRREFYFVYGNINPQALLYFFLYDFFYLQVLYDKKQAKQQNLQNEKHYAEGDKQSF
jgi:hypothetical protein